MPTRLGSSSTRTGERFETGPHTKWVVTLRGVPAGKTGRFRAGWLRGLEPPTFGTTIRRSNQLSYNHRSRKRLYRPADGRSTASRPVPTGSEGPTLQGERLRAADRRL